MAIPSISNGNETTLQSTFSQIINKLTNLNENKKTDSPIQKTDKSKLRYLIKGFTDQVTLNIKEVFSLSGIFKALAVGATFSVLPLPILGFAYRATQIYGGLQVALGLAGTQLLEDEDAEKAAYQVGQGLFYFIPPLIHKWGEAKINKVTKPLKRKISEFLEKNSGKTLTKARDLKEINRKLEAELETIKHQLPEDVRRRIDQPTSYPGMRADSHGQASFSGEIHLPEALLNQKWNDEKIKELYQIVTNLLKIHEGQHLADMQSHLPEIFAYCRKHNLPNPGVGQLFPNYLRTRELPPLIESLRANFFHPMRKYEALAYTRQHQVTNEHLAGINWRETIARLVPQNPSPEIANQWNTMADSFPIVFGYPLGLNLQEYLTLTTSFYPRTLTLGKFVEFHFIEMGAIFAFVNNLTA